MSTIAANTLTNNAGTGAPDFLGMPTVDGTPVVESGSNSDGEWTRWADGTQHCTASPAVGLTFGAGGAMGSGLYRSKTLNGEDGKWNYPVVFTEIYDVCPGQVSSNPGWASCHTANISQATFLFYANTELYNIGFGATATGRWK